MSVSRLKTDKTRKKRGNRQELSACVMGVELALLGLEMVLWIVHENVAV